MSKLQGSSHQYFESNSQHNALAVYLVIIKGCDIFRHCPVAGYAPVCTEQARAGPASLYCSPPNCLEVRCLTEWEPHFFD